MVMEPLLVCAFGFRQSAYRLSSIRLLDDCLSPTRLSPMKTYNIHEAKTHLSRLVQAAADGEEIVIAKAGKPMAKLVAISTQAGPRVLGALAGAVREADDCWAPDPEMESLFYGAEPDASDSRRVAERPKSE